MEGEVTHHNLRIKGQMVVVTIDLDADTGPFVSYPRSLKNDDDLIAGVNEITRNTGFKVVWDSEVPDGLYRSRSLLV